MGTRGHGPVHTAHGRSESKHLKPTPAGHAEGCPVIALCRPGSPWRAGRGPVSVSQAPAASPRSTGQGPPSHRDAPSPALAARLSSAGPKSLAHLCQGHSGQEPGPPGLPGPQPFSWLGGSGGVAVGGASGPPGPGREVKSGAE